MLNSVALSFHGEKLVVKVVRSNRKTVSFEMNRDWELFLRIPKGLQDAEIIRFMRDREPALLRCIERAVEKFPQPGNRWKDVYKDGAELPFGDEKIILHLLETQKMRASVWMRAEPGGGKHLYVKSCDLSSDEVRRLVTDWMRRCAKEALIQKTEIFSERMGVTWERIAIKEQKSRWGSCSSKGNLNFNWKLILMPERIQDYIVVHELAHRREMNHSPQFWSQVEKVLPDYRERVRWQRQHEAEYFVY